MNPTLHRLSFLLVLMLFSTHTLSASDSNNTKNVVETKIDNRVIVDRKCTKAEIYSFELEENTQKQKVLNYMDNFNEICVWDEMYQLNPQKKCEDFKNRYVVFSDVYEQFNKDLKKLENNMNNWNEYKLCDNNLRFVAIDFEKNSQVYLNDLQEKISILNECKANIEKNMEYFCDKQNQSTPDNKILKMQKIN